MQPKPASRSKIIISGLATSLCGLASAALIALQDPANYSKASDCLSSFGQDDWAATALKVSATAPILLGLLTSLLRLYSSSPVYTPRNFPGPNKPRTLD
jgi:hypothetical protein